MIQKKPLVMDLYTADPSAHVFNDKIYIYPSHDEDIDVESNDNGDQYDMKETTSMRWLTRTPFPVTADACSSWMMGREERDIAVI